MGGTYFNTADGAMNCLVETDLDLVDMVVPDVSTAPGHIQTMYGDWEAGSIHRGTNYYPTKDRHCELGTIDAKFWTKDAVFTPSKNSYFEITIWDARTSGTIKAITERIGNTSTDLLLVAGDNKNIAVKIEDFTEQEVGYTFKPVFKFDLSEILTRRLPNSHCMCDHSHTHHHHHEDDHICTCHIFGGRFRIEIAHIINENCRYVYKTEDFIYNTGHLPRVTEFNVSIDNNQNDYREMYCSGIKYMTQGKLNYACAVDKLNYWTASPVKMSLDTVLLSEPYKYDEATQWSYYTLDYNGNNYQFSYSQNIASALVVSGEQIVVSGMTFNGYGNTKFGLAKAFMINSNINCVCEFSTDTIETFVDESKRCASNMKPWKSEWNLTSTFETAAGGAVNSLMVVPNKGLTYPKGTFNFGESIPEQRYNYNDLIGIRYFYREFFGQYRDVKYGGVFKIDGLTEAAFNHPDFKLEISIDNGRTWLDCKKDRQLYESTKVNSSIFETANADIENYVADGIFAGLKEYENGLEIKFAFNRDFYLDEVIEPCIMGNTHIWFKLGFSDKLKDLTINRIELLNLDGKTNW
jgi:hypothetical protein